MLQEFEAHNATDLEGNPAGGLVIAIGLTITWQNGPLGRKPNQHIPNGAFVETVIAAALQRLRWYQEASDGRFKCEENANAIDYLEGALEVLDERTREREARGVEGTHQK